MKIGILVLAHENPDQLNRLVDHLARDFFVYVHLDKKSPLSASDLDPHPRVATIKQHRVHWGHHSQILASFTLLRLAHADGCDHFLLISGADIPIKSNRHIREFFERHPHDCLLSTRIPTATWPEDGLDRLTLFHPSHRRYRNRLAQSSHRALVRMVLALNKRLGIERRLDFVPYGGPNWFNLKRDTVDKILRYVDAHPEYLDRFKYTHCADEFVIQSLLPLIGADAAMNDSLRYVDWKSGPERPRILRRDDIDKLLRSSHLFARKIDDRIDDAVSTYFFAHLSRDPEHSENGVSDAPAAPPAPWDSAAGSAVRP